MFNIIREMKTKTTMREHIIPIAAAAKSLQSCQTLCDPIDGSPPGFPISGILQPRTLEWVAISFSNAWKWKVKAKLLSSVLPQQPHGLQPTRLLRPWDSPGKSTGVGCHCLLHLSRLSYSKYRPSVIFLFPIVRFGISEVHIFLMCSTRKGITNACKFSRWSI